MITPIGKVCGPDGEFTMGTGVSNGAIAQGLRGQLTDLQRGAAADPYGWVHKVF